MTSTKKTRAKMTAEETTEEVKETVMEVITTPAEDKQIFIYLGPNLRDGSLRTNQVFKGGKPEIRGVTDTYPLINELFAPIERRQEFVNEINKKGSLLNTAYAEIKGV